MGKKKIVSLFFLTLLWVGIFTPGYLKIKALMEENRELERQIVEVRQFNKRLRQQQQKLLNDPVYLEKVAREKLGMVREGEVIYKVVPDEKLR